MSKYNSSGDEDKMAQLIKLQDYISRYEQDIYQYPSHYIQLKKKNWELIRLAFDKGESLIAEEEIVEEAETRAKEKSTFLDNLKTLFQRRNKEVMVEEQQEPVMTEEKLFEKSLRHFTTEPKTIEDLKILFLDNLFQLQTQWASSTVLTSQAIPYSLYYNEHLKYFLQRFPDNYLLLYNPVLKLKKAPIETDLILISPLETICISIVEGKENGIFQYNQGIFWKYLDGEDEKKIVNPFISLNRTGLIVQKLYERANCDFPVRKVVLNRKGYFDCPIVPHDTMLVDRRNYGEWFEQLRTLTTPLKHRQLKAAKALLTSTQNTLVTKEEE